MAIVNELSDFLIGATTLFQCTHHIKLIELVLARHQDAMSSSLFTPQLLIVELLFEMIAKLVELVSKVPLRDHVLELDECLTAYQNKGRCCVVRELELLPASPDL